MVSPGKEAFIRQLLAFESTTNEQIAMVVSAISEYYTELLLGNDDEKISKYFAYLCYEYKGVEFGERRVVDPE